MGVKEDLVKLKGNVLKWTATDEGYRGFVAGILLGATQIVGLFGASGASIDLPGQADLSAAGEGSDGRTHSLDRASYSEPTGRRTAMSSICANHLTALPAFHKAQRRRPGTKPRP